MSGSRVTIDRAELNCRLTQAIRAGFSHSAPSRAPLQEISTAAIVLRLPQASLFEAGASVLAQLRRARFLSMRLWFRARLLAQKTKERHLGK